MSKARDALPMTALRFPSSLDRITPEILTALLAEQRPGVLVSAVNVLDSASRGDGLASTADRVALELEYEADAGLPSRMMLKTVLLHSGLRFGPSAIQLTGKVLDLLGALPFGSGLRPWVFSAIGAYQRRYPHAPDAMYVNEVRFYREIRPQLSIEAPECFGSVFDEAHRSFGVLMENLALRGARFPDASTGVDVDEIRGLLATLAALHARFWESRALESELGWLATPTSGGMYPVFQALGLDQLWDAVWKAQQILAGGPQTLLHGDPHIGNSYLLPGSRGGFLDWQLMIKGRWSHDFTYLVTTGLSTEDRRLHEHDLLTFYLDELARQGVQSPPTQDEAWLRYRQAAIWGLVIGWLITPTENYGEAITAANISRLATAVQDLETLKALA